MIRKEFSRYLTFATIYLSSSVFASEEGNPESGRIVFEQLCGICHSVAQDGSGPPMGPNLFGLLGREIGAEPNFAMYSPALQEMGEVWTAENLDEFLADPVSKVPGTTMPVMLPDPQERADVIAYLSTLSW